MSTSPQAVPPQDGSLSTDPYATLRERVLHRVLQGPADTDAVIRMAVADRTGVPQELQSLVDSIHDHAYRVTDDDVARVQALYGDDRTFEIVVSAALGASRRRLLAGLSALEDA